MYAKFFKAPVLESTFSDDMLFATDRIVSYEYVKRFSKVGDFSIVLPFDIDILKSLQINCTIYIDGDWLWVQNIFYDGRQIILSGKDCKGFLDTRIAVYGQTQSSGSDGYDVVSGTTAYCAKHYLENNCINPIDNSRKLPLSWGGGAVGLENDSYMARFEYLSDIINQLCDNADIGYDVRGNLSGSGFSFYLIESVNRGFNQSERPRIIFSSAWRNIVSQNFEHGVDNLYNTIYATDKSIYTKTVYRNNITSSGINRRECNISVSVEITDDYFEKYALNSVQDNIETHSYEISAAVSSGYGVDYQIGDIVSIKDDFINNIFNAKITEVAKSYNQGRKSLSLTLGRQKAKPINRIVNNMLNKTQRRR